MNKNKSQFRNKQKSSQINGLGPLYFCSQISKNLSRKESFYQFLFIQTILENKKNNAAKGNLIKDKSESIFSRQVFKEFENEQEWKKFISNHPLKKFIENSNQLSKQRSSVLVETLTSSHKMESNNHLFIKPSSLNDFSYNKIFISYKKSFLSYWLLPLLGLIGTINNDFHTESPPLENPVILGSIDTNIFTKDNFSYNSKSIKNNSNSDYFAKLSIGNKINSKNKIYLSNSNRNELREKKQYDQYSKSLILLALKSYQNDNKMESLLLKRNIKKQDLDFRNINLKILQQNLQKRSSFNWTWFNLEYNLLSKQNEISNFPDKISNLVLIENQSNHKKYSNILNQKISSRKFGEVPKNKNLHSKFKNQILKLNPINILIDKCHVQNQKIVLNDENLSKKYLIGIVNKKIQQSSKNISSKINFLKDSKKPSHSINKSFFLIDKLFINKPSLFNSMLSIKNVVKEANQMVVFPLEKQIYSEFESNNLSSSRKKTINLIFKNKKNAICPLPFRDPFSQSEGVKPLKELTRSKLDNTKNKKMISSVNSDTIYYSIIAGLKENLNLIIDSNLYPCNFNTKDRIVKKSISISNKSQLKNFKINNLVRNYEISKPAIKPSNLSMFGLKFKPIFEYSSLNINNLLQFDAKNKIFNSFGGSQKINALTKNSNIKGEMEKASNQYLLKSNWDKLFKDTFLKERLIKSNFSPIVNKKFINVGKLAPIEMEGGLSNKFDKNNCEKPIIMAESTINISKKESVFIKSKNLNQIKVKNSDFFEKNQQNSFLNTGHYINKMTNEIKKALNPYKFRLSYLPKMSVHSSHSVKGETKKLNNIKSKSTNLKMTLRQTQNNIKKSPNFEKVFLSYLSRSKKLTDSLKSTNNIQFGNLTKKLKLKTKQRLKSLNNRYFRMKSETLMSKRRFNNLDKNSSSLMILKNRLFLNKMCNKNDLAEKNSEGSYSLLTIKTRQDLKVKRRLKKMKCETRRRKKRKIFYPRPNWIIFSLYKKFLDSRYSLNLVKSSKIITKTKNSNHLLISNLNLKGLKKNSYKQSYSHWLTNKRLSLDNEVFQKNITLKNSNDFYKISKTVLSDLRRVLMKSNWLKSYLNPYLEKVKTIYQELQNSSKKMVISNNFRGLIDFIYGSPINTLEDAYLTLDNLNKIQNESKIVSPIMLNSKIVSYQSQNYQNLIENRKSLKNQNNSVGISSINSRNGMMPVLTREQEINLVEYNRIVYQRIQKSILNIRENLNLNGEIKNRSKKLSRNFRPFIKRDYIKREMINGIPTNQTSGFWSKLFKNNVLKFGRSFINQGYDEQSPYNNSAQLLTRNNFYWALNKTSMFTTPNFNSSFTKKLWESSKIREISKSNKTKKILFNLFMKYSSIFNSTTALNGYDHILGVFKNDPEFINSKEFEKSKLTKFFYKKNNLPKTPILNYTNYSLDDEITQVPLNLAPKIYINKTEQKLLNTENKIKLLGLYSKKVEQNYKNTYFRFLKQELLKENKFYYSNNLETNEVSQSYGKRLMYLFEKLKQKSFNSMNDINFSRANYKNKIGINNSYWWGSLKQDIDYLDQKEILNQNFQNNLKMPVLNTSSLSIKNPGLISLSTFLFHFCVLISFVSLGGIRTLIKFYYILILKVSKGIISLEKLKKLVPGSKGSVARSAESEQSKSQYTSRFSNFDEYPSADKGGESEGISKTKNNENELLNSTVGQIINLKKIKRFFRVPTRLLAAKQTNILKNLKLNLLSFLIQKGTKTNNFNLNFANLKGFSKESLYFPKNFESQNLIPQSYQLNSKIKNEFLVIKNTNLNKINTGLFKSNKIKDFEFNLLNFNALLNLVLKNSNTKSQKSLKTPKQNSILLKNKLKLQYLGFIKGSNLARFIYKGSFYGYLAFLRSIDILSIPASFIYKFFEKPGEYVVENLAYNFLVEWSSDLSTTIPDTIDTNSTLYFAKLNRMTNSLIILNNNFIGNLLNKSSTNNLFINFNLFAQNVFLASILSSITKRVFNSSFIIFIQQLCEPDLDFINRQKKARSIWDIWGEDLQTIAEDNSINIYELTTDKQEQIKLLSKYEDSLQSSNNFKGENFNNYLIFKHSLYSLKTQQSYKKFNFVNKNNKKINSKDSENIESRVNKLIKTIPFINKITKTLKNPLRWSIAKQNYAFLEEKTFHGISKNFPAQSKKSSYNYYGWSVNQFLTYQGKDSDLFIDLHPPKTFLSSGRVLKYSYSVQQPIGSIVCQIFSGIFYKQISKNVLVVGSEGLEKTLLIQAIAGETELKIITDSAHRYAMVHRGVAVGIKLLKDVFEALSMHTPCIFLIEDIHAIGERRPFLIDEGSSNSIESPYNKNQSMQGLLLKQKSSASREILYKNNKHLLSHYKKPYKEVRGLATNHFCFTFLFGDIFAKIRSNEIKLSSGLVVQIMKKQNQSKLNSMKSNTKNKSFNSANSIYSSTLSVNSSIAQSAPASSPFNILILNDSTKLKHKKAVKEMAWFGLPGEQFSLVSKYNYSIRVKVALLADLVLSNISVKLDMITDLLVIIDSVKSNRGFAVFATTHMPYILDPALRRPGRFDETISIPLIPGLYSRWSNYVSNIQYLRSSLFNQYSVPFNSLLNKGITLDLTNYCLLSNSSNQSFPINKLINYINNSRNPILNPSNSLFKNTKLKEMDLNEKIKPSWKYLMPSLRNYRLNSQVVDKNKLLPIYVSDSNVFLVLKSLKIYSNSLNAFNQTNSLSESLISSSNNKLNLLKSKKRSNQLVNQLRSKNYAYAYKALLSLFVYNYEISQQDSLENVQLNSTDSSLKWPNLLKDLDNSFQDNSIYLSLFSSDKLMFKLILMSLIGSKVGENFSNSFATKSSKINLNSNNFSNRINDSFLFNFDKAWKYGSSLLLNYIQKRQCTSLQKNLAFCTSNLISFNNKYSLMEPPSPPISNILLPTKRYENYKRSFNNQYEGFNQQNNFKTNEKLQFHQQQRLLRRLYKYPLKEFFRSHLLRSNKSLSNLSSFNNSYLSLSPLENNKFNSIHKLSTVNWSYRNILYNRHKTYLTNQWWTGLQGEHNAESTFLSDIDWRYTFVESIGDIQIDFPDSEQFYNPRNRRWILTSGDWNYWFNMESDVKQIYSNFVYESFIAAYKYLDQNREVIDFYVEFLHQNSLPHNLNDRNLINLYKRFSL